MKQTKLISLIACITIILLSACKKTNQENTPENPAQATINNKLVVDTLNITLVNIATEYGNVISFTKDGKLTQLGCRSNVKGSIKVTFWDNDSHSPLTSQIVTVTDTKNFTYTNIAPIDVVSNKKYVISMYLLPGLAYIATKKNSAVSIYPFTTGNITYLQRVTKSSVVSTFPSSPAGIKDLLGIPDFTFIAN